MDLSIITVNFSDKHILEQIASVRPGAAGLSFEQIVSDNGSVDGSLAEIKNKFPEVKIVENGKNIGFGGGNNNGAKISSGDYLLFLNPDMRVAPGSLKIIVDWMRLRPEVGIASCKLVDQYGKFNEGAKPRRFPTALSQLAVFFKLPHLFPHILDGYLYKDFDFNREQEVDSVRGSFMLIRREIYDRLGWAFDPRYFVWFEDVDTCREAKRLGFKVVYTPIISCVDYVGQTFKKQRFFWKQWNFFKSAVKYFYKWGI